MREHKFRAWIPTEKRMGTPFTLREVANEDGTFGDDIVFLECTGITDTHDKEIFEGDILENEFGKRASVKWDFSSLAALQDQSHRATIIGNIYETPELLERKV